MEIQFLPLGRLRVERSRFRLSPPSLFNLPGEKSEALEASIRQSQILEPVLVRAEGRGDYDLVDGFQRVAFVGGKGWPEIPCVVLPPSVSDGEILHLMLCARLDRITRSVVSKSCFLSLGLALGIPEEELIAEYLPLLQFEPHAFVLKKLRAVAQLPEEVLSFCHEKSFSMKQCEYLTTRPLDLVKLVFSWEKDFTLTASILEEMVEHLSDYLKANEMKVSELLELDEVQEVFSLPISPQERTKQFREWLRKKRYPILTETNSRMEEVRDEMALPPKAGVVWDKTLERHELNFHIRLSDVDEWDGIIRSLQDLKVKMGIKKLFDSL